MTIISFSVGNQCSYVGCLINDCPEIITTEYGGKSTPTFVSIRPENRIVGNVAKNELFFNLENTVFNFRNIIGEEDMDEIKKYEHYLPNTFSKDTNNHIALQFKYKNKDLVLNPVQLLATLLKHMKDDFLKNNPEMFKMEEVEEIVITCPYYFTNSQKMCLVVACEIAEIKCTKILDENLAIALAYDNIPCICSENKNVLFVSIGASSTDISLFCFKSSTEILLLEQNTLLDVGGMYFDSVLFDYVVGELKAKYNIESPSNKKDYLRLLFECESIKKKLGHSNENYFIKLDNFSGKEQVSVTISMKIFDKISKLLYQKITKSLECLGAVFSIDEIVLAGGSTRLPMISKIIHTVFKKNPKTTINQEECVALGAVIFGQHNKGSDLKLESFKKYLLDNHVFYVHNHEYKNNDKIKSSIQVNNSAIEPVIEDNELGDGVESPKVSHKEHHWLIEMPLNLFRTIKEFYIFTLAFYFNHFGILQIEMNEELAYSKIDAPYSSNELDNKNIPIHNIINDSMLQRFKAQEIEFIQDEMILKDIAVRNYEFENKINILIEYIENIVENIEQRNKYIEELETIVDWISSNDCQETDKDYDATFKKVQDIERLVKFVETSV